MDSYDGELEQAQAETRAAFENRAMMYSAIWDELSDELGEDRAGEIMKRAIHRRGLEVGRKYRAAASDGDLEAVGDIFVSGSPAGGTLFTPSVAETGDDVIVLAMESCPLVDAWTAEGRRPDEIDRLCEIAAAVDEGTFEAAGLDLVFLERIGAGCERCLLQLRTR